MNHDVDDTDRVIELSDLDRHPTRLPPPPELEERVVRALSSRGLLRASPARTEVSGGRRVARFALAAAAAFALVTLGAAIGRSTARTTAPPGSLTGAEGNLYALLLYETDGYVPPKADQMLALYREYSEWVAEARRRDQFVTGEDFDLERGWLVSPSPDAPTVSRANALAASAPLSGIFFILAADPEQALELARALPHVRHGGQVLVQKTIPTDKPPP